MCWFWHCRELPRISSDILKDVIRTTNDDMEFRGLEDSMCNFVASTVSTNDLAPSSGDDEVRAPHIYGTYSWRVIWGHVIKTTAFEFILACFHVQFFVNQYVWPATCFGCICIYYHILCVEMLLSLCIKSSVQLSVILLLCINTCAWHSALNRCCIFKMKNENTHTSHVCCIIIVISSESAIHESLSPHRTHDVIIITLLQRQNDVIST